MLTVFFAGFFFTACSKKNSETQTKVKNLKTQDITKSNPHGLVFFGGYWKLEDENMTYFADAVPGTSVEIPLKDGKIEKRKTLGSEGNSQNYIRIKLDDDFFWISEENILLDAMPYYILETGTDVYLYEMPDADSAHTTKLAPDTIVALMEKCEDSKEHAEGKKFGLIKIPASTAGEYTQGYIRLTNIDDNPSHLAMIQVSKKYSSLLNSENVSPAILDELADTAEELRSWSIR